MCGIAGIFGNGLGQEEAVELKRMTDAVSHRGPDADGFYYDNEKKCFFGHRRLSIIDLSQRANQPMADLDGEIIIVFNGEIYNYLDIRKELEGEFVFRTDHSDTETIIYAYRKWGIGFLEKINGMFAIAIYDKRRNKLLLIRDRFGKKPLYYTLLKGKIYFSSEIRSLFTLKGLLREPNIQAIYNYLTFLTTYPPETLFKNVFKVKASHYVEMSLCGETLETREAKYWDISHFLNVVRDVNYKEAISTTRELLKRSVSLRNISDVPVAISLSGGIDSSLNLALSWEVNHSINAINISHTNINPDLDESGYAERLAKRKGVNFIGIKVDNNEYMEYYKQLADRLLDFPVLWPDMVLMYIISRKLRDSGIKVVLVGEGGDELGAYPIYFSILERYKKYNSLKPLLRIAKALAFLSEKLDSRLDALYQGSLISYRHIHAFTEHEKKLFWKGPPASSSYAILAGIMKEIKVAGGEGFIRRIINLEYKLRLPELLLPRIDYSTMSNSVEARAPFLDYKLVEESMMIPFLVRNRNGPKSIIKEIAGECLPDYILSRAKAGFGREFSVFFSQDFNKWFEDEIIRVQAPIKNYINPTFLDRIYNENLRQRKRGYQLWVIYTLNKWLINNFG